VSSIHPSANYAPPKTGRAQKIRAVILDYGEVLCHHPTREEIQRSASLFQVAPEDFPKLYMRNRGAYDRGDLTAHDYWRKFAEATGAEINDAQIEDLRRWDLEMWSTANATMMKWVKNLRATGIKTAILSNMPWDMARHARKTFPWLSDFDCHVFSCEIGEIKPSAIIYRRCLDGLAVEADEAIFIDDRETNVQGARAVGIHGIQFESCEQLAGALEAMGFSVLPDRN
jgi:putative hydrolase of the HAD superfamily